MVIRSKFIHENNRENEVGPIVVQQVATNASYHDDLRQKIIVGIITT